MKHIFFCLVAMCAVVLASLPITNYLQLTNNAHAAALVDFTISGNVKADGSNLQGASVSLTGTQSQTTLTDANGNYSFTVSPGGNYTVSVYKSGYSFNPATQAFNNLQSSQTANFQNGVPLPAPRPLGLVAWYKAEGNAADSAGNAYNGTLVGGATFAAGKVGQAFNLDGVDDRVEVASNIVIDPTNTGALAAWVRFNQLPSAAGHNMAIINKSDLMSSFDLSAETDNKFHFNVGLGNSVSSATVVQAGVWYFVVGVWDSTGLSIYVNGVLENTNSTQNVVRTQSAVPLKIGEGGPLAGQFFHGLIDEAQVYNRALISTEVETIYTAGSAGISLGVFLPPVGNGKILFERHFPPPPPSPSPYNIDIFTMNSDGTNQTNITNTMVVDYDPDWSPDGGKIVFVSTSNGIDSDIYVMNANGTNRTQITTGTHSDTNPSWSPDGTKIVFTSNRDHFRFEIYVMNADGSNITRLTNNELFEDNPHWSPDGGKIVFSNGVGNSVEEIYVMNADGTNQIRLTNDAREDAEPSFSPDGTKILFTKEPVNNNLEIFIMNADGSNPTNISNHPSNDVAAAWSPDGTKIVFTTNRDGNLEVYRMNANGSGQTRLTNNQQNDVSSSWQPILNEVIISPVNNVRLTFASIARAGYTVATPLLQPEIPALPSGYALVSPTQAYDIRTSGQFSGNVTIRFDVPNVADAAACSRLRVLHFENGEWTAANNATPVYNSSTQVCTISQTAASLGLFVVAQCVPRVLYDFDGDRKADLSIFRPSNGQWWYQQSSDGVTKAATFGVSTDKIVPEDYDGDGKTDLAFFRPSTGEWFVLRSSNNTFFAAPFGNSTDKPSPGDFDGDGKADLAVYRQSTGTWFIYKSTGGVLIIPFGASQDIPEVADYDGDCKADVAIFRPNGAGGNGEWWILRSSNNSVFATPFGLATDKPAPADYTGDGKADIAFWRPSNGYWYVLRSEDNSFYAGPFGASSDIPVPGDYDSDGKADFAVFRPSGSVWFLLRSSQGTYIQPFGLDGDKPVPSAFIP